MTTYLPLPRPGGDADTMRVQHGLLRYVREAAALGAFLVMAMRGLLFLDLAEELAAQGARGLDYEVLEARRAWSAVASNCATRWPSSRRRGSCGGDRAR